MENREKLVELYLIYKNLLTNNEITYFEYYYYEDYSLTEISEVMKVSKANVSKVLNVICNKLYDYENKLNISTNHRKIKDIIIKLNNKELLEKIDELL
jgi:uncharacterized protein